MSRTAVVLTLLLIVGALVRVGYLVPSLMDSDQAVFGLQGRHVLLGEFPVFSWGYAYIGTLQSYLDAPAFAVFGASRLVLNAVTLVLALLFVLVTGALGRELGGRRAGLAAALLVALAPPYLALHGAWARHGYMDTLVLGSLVLLLALRLVRRRRSPAGEARDFALLGLIGGLAWWTNALSLFYLVPAALFLLVHDGRALRRRGPWLALAFFLLGSAPFWAWNAGHAFQSFRLFKGGETREAARQLWRVLADGLPALLGARGSHARENFVPGLSEAVVLIYLAALVWLVARQVGGRLRRRTVDPGPDLLLLFLGCSATVLSVSRYGEAITAEGTKRYLLPLYSGLPVLCALFVARVGERSRVAAGLLLALPLALSGYGNVVSYPLVKGELAAFRQARRDDEGLFAFLEARRLRDVYVTDYWLAPRLTFDAGEAVVFAQPIGDRYPPYVRRLDASPRVAYLFSAGAGAAFDAHLRGIGATFEKSLVGPYEVFHEFSAPAGLDALRSLAGAGWRATASSVVTAPGLAFDRDVDSSWLSGEPLRPGLFFELDLGRPTTVAKLVLVSPRPSLGRPRGYRVEVSRDGRRWEETAAVGHVGFALDWAGGQPRLGPGGRVVSAFAPREVRYLRVQQTGSDPRWWWAIGEVFVYGPGPGGPDGVPASTPPARAHLDHGAAHEARGRLATAVREYWRATRLEPDLEAAHVRLAALYERAGVPLEGAAPPATRALAFERLGLWAKAGREYEKAIERDTAGADRAGLEERLRRAAREAGAEPVSTR